MVKSGGATRGAPALFLRDWGTVRHGGPQRRWWGVGWEGEESASGICIIGTWYLIRFVSLGGGQT